MMYDPCRIQFFESSVLSRDASHALKNVGAIEMSPME